MGARYTCYVLGYIFACLGQAGETSLFVYKDAGNDLPMVRQENVRTGRNLLKGKVMDKIDRQRSAK